MAWSTLQSVGLGLALLGYLLITCILTILAAHRRNITDVHDRVRTSKRLRADYLRALAEKQIS